MSDGGRIPSLGTPKAEAVPAAEDPRYLGNSVHSDRAWAQNRIGQFFRGQQSPIMRKAAGGAPQHGERGLDAKVSEPGEPAEKEADAVADHVADVMHGGGEKGDAQHGAPGKEQAPAIGAKLQPGAISLAKDKKNAGVQGDSVEKQVQTLRAGGTVRVKSIEEARKILGAMPELKPATEDRKMPNPDKKMADGFEDPPGTYRGDLINKKNPEGRRPPWSDESRARQQPALQHQAAER